MGPFVPPRGRHLGDRHSPPHVQLSDGRSYLKIDFTKKWVFCLIRGVFEIGLLR